MSKSLLDLMPKAEAEKAIERGKKRLERQHARKSLDITPEIYLVAEMGYYFGWEAVMAIRRGYTVVPGANEKEVFTLEEAQVLLEGARKVWYSKLVEESQVAIVGSSFKTGSKSFDGAVRQFRERAEVTE